MKVMLSGPMFGRQRLVLIAVAIAVFVALLWLGTRLPLPRNEVHFSSDIRPILNQNCVQCHGGVR